MQLFITDKPREESKQAGGDDPTPFAQRDNEGATMQAWCEVCNSYDKLINLSLFHPTANRGEHVVSHPECMIQLAGPEEYEICKC